MGADQLLEIGLLSGENQKENSSGTNPVVILR
jgi:hypothetical protein